MLQIKNLSMIHKKDLRSMLDNFSFVINPGDKAVVIGEEGNGKSTLLKWIYDPRLTEDYAEIQGERIISGERLGYLPQELPEADHGKTIYEYFMESEAFCLKSPKETGRLSAMMNLPETIVYSDQLMETLSGGERVKVQMMRLLMEDATILLLDEPSNDIDIATLEWMEQLILDFSGAVLFISHDEILIEKTANMVIHLEQLRRKSVSKATVMHLSFPAYAALRQSSLRNQEELARSQRREQKRREEKFRRICQKVEHEQAGISRQDPHGGRLLKKKMHAVKSLEHRYEREKEEMAEVPDQEEAMYFRFDEKSPGIPAGKTVLDFTCEKLISPDGTTVLARNITLLVKGPEKICILGENGAGKSTLIKLIARKLLSRDDIKAQYMPQNYGDNLDEAVSPVEYLSITFDKEEQTRIRTFLGSMKYTAEEMDHKIAELSGGQKAKLLMLKMSMSGANVLILDEPTRNFSPLSGPVIRKMLKDFSGAIISVSHDRKYIEEVCGKAFELTENGLVKIEKY